MNHKWNDDQCIYCGIKREKREAKIFKGTRSVLRRAGYWDDVPVYDWRIAWAFSFDGGKWTFSRPDCVRKNLLNQKPNSDAESAIV